MRSQCLNLPGWIRGCCCVAYAALVAWLSLAPASTFANLPGPLSWHGVDKVLHFLMYGILVLLLRWTLADRCLFPLSRWLVVLGAATYGLGMELGQSWLVQYHRSFEVGDLIANTAGAVAFWWLAGCLFGKPTAAPELATAECEPQPAVLE